MDEPPKKKWFLHLISAHPLGAVIAFVGALASIIGLGLWFFPWLNAPKPELSFCVNPARAPIVQTANASPVSVSYAGIPVAGNVTAAQIAVWNAGRAPIRHEDILKPIVLRTCEDCGILGISVLYVRRDVSDFHAISVTNASVIVSSNGVPASTNMAALFASALPRTVSLDWKILEHNDGAIIQIVYTGTTEAPIKMTGVIVGQEQQSPIEKVKQTKEPIAIWIVYVGIGLIGAAFLGAKPIRSKVKERVVSVILMLLWVSGFLLIRGHYSALSCTPFGF